MLELGLIGDSAAGKFVLFIGARGYGNGEWWSHPAHQHTFPVPDNTVWEGHCETFEGEQWVSYVS